MLSAHSHVYKPMSDTLFYRILIGKELFETMQEALCDVLVYVFLPVISS